jgi:hypothetical protein
MDSALIDFLKKDYPAHFGQKWEEDTMKIRRDQCPKGKVEIRDGQPQIVQYTGSGVSVINNNSEIDVEIIDFEHYINIFHDTDAGMGRKCDFIINPIAGYDFIVFNELTESEKQYIMPFTSPKTGEEKEGKLAYAKKQLEVSIEKFYSVSNFLDGYERKVALFSCRLTDNGSNGIMSKSLRAFRKPQRIFANIRAHELLIHGFVFEQRIYDNEYKVI